MKHIQTPQSVDMLLILVAVICSSAFASEFSGGSYALRQFMNWYVPGSGVWQGHLSYAPDWCRGNGVEALANFYLDNEDKINNNEKDYIWQVLLDVQDNQGGSFYQTADYFDDVLWWSLAFSRVYEIAFKRGNESAANYFLQNAMSINDVVSNDSWSEGTCGGGVYWSRDFSYKNAITNELYLTSSARLAYLTNESRFSERAKKSLDWLLSSGMMDSDALFVDGLDSSCQPTGAKYTYNQGVILGGLVESNRLAPNVSLIQLGERIASSVAIGMTDTNGILTETSCGDGALFKGIYTRYLRYFIDLSQSSQRASFDDFLKKQATSVWSNDRDINNGYFGKSWAGPFDYNYHNLQIAALDLFTAVRPITDVAKEKCGAHGMWVTSQCACFTRYSGDSCQQETAWEDYYVNKSVSFTSLTANAFLCASSGVVSSCLSDSQESSTYFTVEKRSTASNEIRLKTSSGLYLSSISGSVIAVTMSSESDDSLYFTVQVVGEDEWSHPMKLEGIRLRSSDGKFVIASKSTVNTSADIKEATIFLVNLKQQCS